MATTIQLKRSNTAGSAPGSLADGEVGINQADGTFFWRTGAAAVRKLLFPKRSAVADAAYTILASDTYVGVSSLSAARAFALPAASAYPVGHTLLVVDESGACSASVTVTLSATSANTINDVASVVLTVPRFAVALQSDGVSKWTATGKGVALAGDASAATVALSDGTTPTIPTAFANVPDQAFTALNAPYAISSRDRARMLHRSVMEWIPRQYWPMIENGTAISNPTDASVVPVHTYIQNALNSGYHIRCVSGQYPVQRGVNLTRQGQCFEGYSRYDTRLVAQSGFDTSSSAPRGVIQSVPYAHIGRIGVYHNQPSNPTKYADFITYPPSFYVAAAQRSVLENVAYFQATIGIHAYGTQASNASGIIITNVRGSALSNDVYIGNIYDYSQITDLHCYWDGYENNSAYASILLNQDVYALNIGHCESLKIGDVSMWQRAVGINNPAASGGYPFTTTINQLKFDGYQSKLVLIDGRTSISNLDWLCDKGVAYNLITQQNGTTVIGVVNGRSVNEVAGYGLVLCQGGSLKFGTGYITGTNGQLAVDVTGGDCDLGGVDFPYGSNVARNYPYIRASGTGRVRAAGSPQDKGSGSGSFFAASNTNVAHRITSDCRLWAISGTDLVADYASATNVGSTL